MHRAITALSLTATALVFLRQRRSEARIKGWHRARERELTEWGTATNDALRRWSEEERKWTDELVKEIEGALKAVPDVIRAEVEQQTKGAR